MLLIAAAEIAALCAVIVVEAVIIPCIVPSLRIRAIAEAAGIIIVIIELVHILYPGSMLSIVYTYITIIYIIPPNVIVI